MDVQYNGGQSGPSTSASISSLGIPTKHIYAKGRLPSPSNSHKHNVHSPTNSHKWNINSPANLCNDKTRQSSPTNSQNSHPETHKLLQSTSQRSVTTATATGQTGETCINVESLELEEEGDQLREAWKRKRRRSINDESTPPYLRSARVGRVSHPLEENLVVGFIHNVVTSLITLVISVPLTVLFIVSLGVATFVRRILSCCSKQGFKQCTTCPSTYLSPHDAQFFLQDGAPVIHSILVIDGALGLRKIKQLISSRVLEAKDGSGQLMYPRLTQNVVSFGGGPAWVKDSQFSVHNHIFTGPSILTEESLQRYVGSLLPRALPSGRPLWEVVVLHDYGVSKDTVLICRLHQCISDGMTLLRVLCQSLSDNQILHIPQKPHFGGTTYGMGLLRALFVGPLTLLTWIFWRPQVNLLTVSKNESHSTSTSKRKKKKTKKKSSCSSCCCCKREHKNNSDYEEECSREKGSAFTVSGDHVDASNTDGSVVIWSAKMSLARVTRIKQVTRTCVNDVLLSALAGALRATFQKYGVVNPPDLKVSISFDLNY